MIRYAFTYDNKAMCTIGISFTEVKQSSVILRCMFSEVCQISLFTVLAQQIIRTWYSKQLQLIAIAYQPLLSIVF